MKRARRSTSWNLCAQRKVPEMTDDESDDYRVGYKRPPREHQFQKGGTKPAGSGRRKGVKPLHILIDQIFQEERPAKIRGKVESRTTIELMLRTATEQALQGGVREKETFFRMVDKLSPGSIDQVPILVESMPGDEGL